MNLNLGAKKAVLMVLVATVVQLVLEVVQPPRVAPKVVFEAWLALATGVGKPVEQLGSVPVQQWVVFVE